MSPEQYKKKLLAGAKRLGMKPGKNPDWGVFIKFGDDTVPHSAALTLGVRFIRKDGVPGAQITRAYTHFDRFIGRTVGGPPSEVDNLFEPVEAVLELLKKAVMSKGKIESHVDRVMESAAVRLQETAAINQIKEIQTLMRWLGITAGWKFLKFGRVVCGFTSKNVQWLAAVAAAKQVKKVADPKHCYVQVLKKNQSIWMAAPYANGIDIQIEMLPDWGVFLFIFDKSTTKKVKYLRDAFAKKESKKSKPESESEEEPAEE